MIKLSQLLLEGKIKVEKTDWSQGDNYPVITINGKEYELELEERETGDDPGTYLFIYGTDDLPQYTFETLGIRGEPTYFYGDEGWEIYSNVEKKYVS
jgi:hypothetical protein